MSNFFDKVVEVLKQDERFFTAEGELLRNAVYEAAMQMDTKLIKALYADATTRERFFVERPSQILCKPPMWCRIEAPHRRYYIWPERIVPQKKMHV
ncbi:hypothetical protein, partial [Dysosmobacter sp. HCP28S3_G4]|uniref:hypothetical protein n=1 Tax=Dysosmobacter sp. HCP28S3_G4 TaxID=3438938 RepID=UPI003F88D045